jgi:fibronectin-binding autotransporter adhesin
MKNRKRINIAALVTLLLARVAGAAALTWDANNTGAGQTNGAGAWLGANQWWDGAGNVTWTGGDDATFGGPATAGGAVTLASPTTVNSLTFNTFTGTYTLGTAGQAITLNNGLTINGSAAAVTISSPITLGGAQTWTNNSASLLTVSAAVSNNGHPLTIDGTGTISLTTALAAGVGGITKNGTGRLQLSNASQLYTGPTIVNGGVLSYGDTSAQLSAANITLNGGVIDQRWTTLFSRSLGAGPGEIQLTGGASGFSNNNGGHEVRLNNSTAYEVVWGASGENSNMSATGFFNPSTLVLQSAFTQNNQNITMSNKFDLNGTTRIIQVNPGINGASTATFSNIIRTSSGTAGITKTGGGILFLSGANTYNGGTTVNQGILTATVTGALPGFATAGSVVVAANATIGVRTGAWTAANIDALRTAATWSATTSRLGLDTTAGNFAYSSDITEPLTINKIGANTLTLSGNNSYTGATILSAGSLAPDSANALGSGDVTFRGGTMQYTVNSAAIDYGSRVKNSTSAMVYNTNGQTATLSGVDGTNTAGLTKSGAGTLILAGTNSYSGGTSHTGGTLVLQGTGALGSGAITWATTGTTLAFRDDASMAVTNTLSTSVRTTTRTLMVDRVTPGAAVNLTFSSQPNFDCSTVFNIQAGANIISGTPTVTFAAGTTSSDSNNGSLGGAAGNGPVMFEPTGVNLVIASIGSSARTRAYVLKGDTTGNQITGAIANGNGTTVNKEGSGTWTLLGSNAYTGTTTVSGGTLKVNGSTLATGLVNVSSGATLGGNGSVGNVTVTDGFLSPGDGLDNTFAVRSLTLDPSSTLVFGLDDPFSFEGNDLIQISNSLTLAGQINIHAQPGGSGYDFLTATPGTQWQVMTYAPGNLFSAGDVTIGSAPALSSGLAWSVDTTSVDGSVFLTVVVPEPASSALLAAGLLVLFLRRRQAA